MKEKTSGKSLQDRIAEHPLFAGLEPRWLEALAACARECTYQAGERLFAEGAEADATYLIEQGRVALEIHEPAHGRARLSTVARGGALGWSWMIAPRRWHFDAVALEETRALRLDGECLRERAERDPRFGYAIARRLMRLMQDRIERLRLQRLDVYRHPRGGLYES